MENRWDYRQVGHLGVVAVGLVELIRFAFAHVHREGLALIAIVRVVWVPVCLDKLSEERVRACGVVRRVREPENVLILCDREVGPLSELR